MAEELLQNTSIYIKRMRPKEFWHTAVGTSALDGGGCSTPSPSNPGMTSYPLCRGCMGPRAVLDECGKIFPSPGLDPRTVQPVASLYTDFRYFCSSIEQGLSSFSQKLLFYSCCNYYVL